uniref:Uncharacterized protein n=1 Tax=uncultured delta proteobacterium HF0200_19J16 TaxID=710831 RepID=E0XUA9_9DELT|nr:hypothetical protein [uncultured delta proteobacterium HF0200_19J16]
MCKDFHLVYHSYFLYIILKISPGNARCFNKTIPYCTTRSH